MSIVKKIKTLCESVSGLPFLYSSRGGLNVLLDNTEYPCVYMTLLKTSSVANENGMLVESAQVAVVVVDKSEYDIDSIENEDIIDRCRLIANNIVQNADTTGEVRVESVQGGERFYNEYDVILTGYAVNVTFAEIIGDSGCEVAPSVAVFSENGSYNVKGVQVAEVAVPPMSEKEQLLNYFRKGGRFLLCYKATEEFDLDISEFPLDRPPYALKDFFHIKGDLKVTINGGILFSGGNCSFDSCVVDGDFWLMGSPTFYSNDALYKMRVGGIVHNRGGFIGGRFISSAVDITKIDLIGAKFADISAVNGWVKITWADIRGTTAVFSFGNIANYTAQTYIGDAEWEGDFDPETYIWQGCISPQQMRYSTEIGARSLCAWCNGMAAVEDGSGLVYITSQQYARLVDASLWSWFEDKAIGKGYTINI